MSAILAALSRFAISVISSSGYLGVAGLMAIESAAIPLPSEVIMPFSGYLASTGRFNLFAVALAGAIGSTIGSAVLYAIGYYGGRPLLEKYGKYVLISHHDIDKGDAYFKKYGDISNFVGRMIPVVRTYISFPAGVAEMNFKKFLAYSFLGSFIWSLFLGYVGVKLGQNWEKLHGAFKGLDYVVVLLVVLGAAWYVRRHLKHRNS